MENFNESDGDFEYEFKEFKTLCFAVLLALTIGIVLSCCVAIASR